MANPPNTFNDLSTWKQAFDALMANDQEVFSRMDLLTASAGEWLPNSWAPVYLAADSLELAGDLTAWFTAGRMVRAQLTGGYVYSAVSSASYSAAGDKTTVTLASAVLDATLAEVRLGILTPGQSVSSVPADVVRTTGDQAIGGNKTLTGNATLSGDITLNGALGGTAVKDEDDMASDSAAAVPTQQSAKAYVDARYPKGFLKGFGYYYNSTDTVRITGGAIDINGEIYTLSFAVDHQRTVTTSWYYLYVNAPSSGNALGADDITTTSTAPTFSQSKNGWYDATGLKRCIGAYYASGGFIQEFKVVGNRFHFQDPFSTLDTSSPALTATALTLTLPDFETILAMIQATVYLFATTSASKARLRIGHPSCADHIIGPGVVAGDSSGMLQAWGYCEIPTNDSQQIDYFMEDNYSGTPTRNVKIYTVGFEFPFGMCR